jgi:hypothetical protein
MTDALCLEVRNRLRSMLVRKTDVIEVVPDTLSSGDRARIILRLHRPETIQDTMFTFFRRDMIKASEDFMQRIADDMNGILDKLSQKRG